MRPAFSSTGQKAGFLLVLLFFLVCPLIVGKRILPPREELYSSAPWGLGDFPYLHDQIYKETNDIDVAFMGSSPIWWGLDTPHVQAELTRSLGRPAVVRSLCWNWDGFDAFYFIAQDLLKHRRVHMIVFCDLSPGTSDEAHSQALHWFRYADNKADLKGLGWRAKVTFYASAILGMPRNLLGSVRSDLPMVRSDEISWGDFHHVGSPALRLGSLPQRESLYGSYKDYRPTPQAKPSEVCLYSPANRSEFEFSSRPLYSTQIAFARKIAALASANHVRLVYLHMPHITEFGSTTIPENAYWPDLFQSNLTMVGIPGAKLFAGLTSDEVKRLYWDVQHLDLNGQIYFTSVVTPRLLQVYEEQAEP